MVKIGSVCAKGSHHTAYIGEDDYGCCGSHYVADILVSVEDIPDLYPEYRNLKTAEEVAEELKKVFRDAEKWREQEEWTNYELNRE